MHLLDCAALRCTALLVRQDGAACRGEAFAYLL